MGWAVGIPQDFAVFEPCRCVFRSDGKQRFDGLCGIVKPSALELYSRKNQSQFGASWETLHCRRSNGLSLHISEIFQQELSKSVSGSGDKRFYRDCLSQQIFGPHSERRCSRAVSVSRYRDLCCKQGASAS